MHIDEFSFGEVLKTFREYKKMSIEELAENICTTEELISFEKGKTYPTIDVLYQIAFKLNVELNYLLNIVSKTNINYAATVMKLVDRYKRERNYEAVYNIIKHEQNNPMFSQNLLKQYLQWHLGICTFFLENNFDKSIDLLYKAIEITNPEKVNLSEREIEILTSISLLYYDNQKYHDAISIFRQSLCDIEKLPDLIDSKGKLKILFGISQALTEVGQYQDSIQYCEMGIALCVNEEKLYLLLEFHYQLGENYVKLGDIQKGKEYFDKCIFLLKLEGKTKLQKIIEEEIGKQFG